jgi:hypothetical protein
MPKGDFESLDLTWGTISSVLPSLARWLSHADRHVRGNAAFIFGGLGDPRGFQVITDILTDRSDRPEGQGMATASSDGRFHVERQIASDAIMPPISWATFAIRERYRFLSPFEGQRGQLDRAAIST